MKIKNTLKKIQMRLLPPSSRSFHSATYDIRHDISGLYEEVGKLHELVAYQTKKIENLEESLAIHDTHMKVYGNVFFHKGHEDESAHEMHKRFFHSLPKAEEPIRTFQLCNGKLLHKLEDICQQYHLDYWLAFGSLIGAASCEGHIPWDDDVDICMMREDAMKLFEILKSNPEYQISLVYDYYVFVKQFRFSHRNSNIPCFIDISIWDWASDTSEEHQYKLKELRHQLVDTLPAYNSKLNYWKENPYLFAPGSNYVVQCEPVDPTKQDPVQTQNEINKIEAYFDEFYNKSKEAGILCDKEHASAVSFGLENYSEDAPWRQFIWSRDMIFPTQKILFEGKPCRVPHKMKDFCDICYPGWPYLPKDILGHDHFSKDLLKNPSVYEAMKKYISEE